MIKRIETEVVSSPKLIAGRIVTSNSHEDLIMIPGPSSSRTDVESTPKLGEQYFDKTLCYAQAREYAKKRIEFCKTVTPVDDSPMSPPAHARGLCWKRCWPRCHNRLILGSVFHKMCKTRCLTRTSARRCTQAASFVGDQLKLSRKRRQMTI